MSRHPEGVGFAKSESFDREQRKARSDLVQVPQRATIRVCHVSTLHEKDDVRIYHKQILSLAQAGYDVSLVARDGGHTHPKVKFFPVETPVSRPLRMLLGQFFALKQLLRAKPRIVQFHDLELLLLACVCKLLGLKVIFDFHEHVYGDLAEKDYVPRWLRKPLATFLTRVTRFCCDWLFDWSIGATPSVCAEIGSSRLTPVNNFPILPPSPPAPRARDAKTVKLIYAGGLTEERGLFTMLEVAQTLEKSQPGRFILDLAGNLQYKKNLGAPLKIPSNVHHHGYLDVKEVEQMYLHSDIGLVLLHFTLNYSKSRPIKLFEMMAAGLPIVASDFPCWRELLAGCDCSIFVEPTDIGSIRDAICWLDEHPEHARRMGKRGQEFVYQKFSWNSEKETLISIYDRISGLTQ